MSQQRIAQQVLDDHLAVSFNGTVKEDLQRNYAEDVTVVSNWGVEHCHDGMRRMAELLRSQLPDCTFAYRLRLVAGEVAMLEWTADSPAGIGARRRRLLRRAERPDPGSDDSLHGHARQLRVPGTLALIGGDEFPRAMRGGARLEEPARRAGRPQAGRLISAISGVPCSTASTASNTARTRSGAGCSASLR